MSIVDMSALNPSAPAFVPSAPVAIPRSGDVDIGLPEDPFELSNISEVSLSPAELEELETVESWVNLMADLEESEADHCIALALRYGDKHRIQEIKQRVAHHKSHKHQGKKSLHKSKLHTARTSGMA